MSDFVARCQQWQAVAEQHGAIFENVRFQESADGDVSVFAIQPGQLVRIWVPKAVLIPWDGIELTDEGQCVLPEYCADAALRSTLDDLLAYLLSPTRIEGHLRLYQAFTDLPEPLSQFLKGYGLLPQLCGDWKPESLIHEMPELSQDLPIRFEPSAARLRKWLLHARIIFLRDGSTVFMPLIDFINHDARGLGFHVLEDGVGVEGQASPSGEVFCLYNYNDSWGLLNAYGFPGRSSFAYSLTFELGLPDGTKLWIGRNTNDFESGTGLSRVPKIEQREERITMSFVLLGAHEAPREAYRSFAAAWSSIGRTDAFEVFCQILRYNWTKMREIRALAQSTDELAGQLIRTALTLQMDALAQQEIG